MTEIAIAGGHGQIAMMLTRELTSGPQPATVRSLIRDADQSDDITEVGGTPVVLDLEHATAEQVAKAISGCDAVVFAAGAGPGSGAERKESVDYGAAATLIEACQQADVPRYVMISAMGAGDPPDGDEVFAVYLRAKARADEELMASDLDWTVVRPGGLTDDPPTGLVQLGRTTPRGEIPREDVATLLAHLLADAEASRHLLVEAIGGDTPIPRAITEAA